MMPWPIVQFKIAFHFFRQAQNFINIYNSCSIIAHKLAIKFFFVYQKTKSQSINQEIKKIHFSSKFNEIQSDIMALNYLGIWVCKSNVFSQFTNYHFKFKRMFILNHYKQNFSQVCNNKLSMQKKIKINYNFKYFCYL